MGLVTALLLTSAHPSGLEPCHASAHAMQTFHQTRAPTVIPVISHDLGDKLHGAMSFDDVKAVHSVLAYGCITCFLTCTLLSAWMVAMLDLCGSEEAALMQIQHIGAITRMPLFLCVSGVCFYISMLAWTLLTNLHLHLFLAIAVVFVFGFVLIMYAAMPSP
jgi:hypothetical protein